VPVKPPPRSEYVAEDEDTADNEDNSLATPCCAEVLAFPKKSQSWTQKANSSVTKYAPKVAWIKT
jgi:hypothetical protein